MPPKSTGGKRKRKAGTRKKSAIPVPSKEDLFHQTFYSDSSSEDAADETLTVRGELRRRRGHKPKRPRSATPVLPTVPVSGDRTMHRVGSEDTSAHGTLISGPDGLQLKIDLTRLLAQGNLTPHKLLEDSQSQLKTLVSSQTSAVVSKQVSFLDLPPEIREPIYRHALVDPDCTINLTQRKNLERSGQLLRVCRGIYEEARVLLYGENSFHLARAHKQRGQYYETVWKEIGYNDIYRFINDIGSHNVASLRYVSIEFEDALPTFTQYLDRSETHKRRYVNDPALIGILNVLGENAKLDKFVAGFRGSRNTSIADYHFMKALCTIRCREFACDSIQPVKIWPVTLQSVKGLIEIQETSDDDIDWAKKKKKVPYMFTDRLH